jgi:tetratricopeptide (TPR) repeat protein
MFDRSESGPIEHPPALFSKVSSWSQLAAVPAVICAVLGGVFGADPTALIGPALLAGTALGISTAPRKRPEAAWAPPAAVLLIAALPLWLPWLAVTGPGGTALGSAGCAWILAARIDVRRLPALGPGAAAGALGLIALLHGVVPNSGLRMIALVGGLLALPAALVELPRKPVPSSDPARDDGLVLGLVLGGAVPILAVAGGPIFGPSPSWLAEAITGVAAGVAGAAALRRLAPQVGRGLALLLPVALLGAGLALLTGHDRIAWLIGQGVPAMAGGAPLAAGLLTGGLFAGVGFTAGPGGPRTAAGLAVGAVLWAALPDGLGADLAIRALVAAAALRVLWVVVGTETRWMRAAAVAAAAAGLGGLALPAPPAGIRAVAPYGAFGDLGQLGLLDLAAGWRAGESRASARGSVAVLNDLRPPVRWQRGQSIDRSRETISSDAFFAHLPGLLRGDAPTSILILGGGHGGIADSARRATAGRVVIALRSPADRWLVRSQGDWNRNVAADPAVQLGRPARGDRFGAVLVDLPPVWVPGAAADWSPARIDRVADQLAPEGIAVFRMPLASLAGDELAAFAGDVAGRFSQVTAWLDPTGSRHLLLAAREASGPIDAGAVWRAWSRRAVRDELRRTALTTPVDALERLLTDRDGLLAMAAGRARRDRFSAAVVAGVRVRAGRRALPLAILGAAGTTPTRLFDFGTVPPDERDALQARLTDALAARADYLELLEALASGDSMGALDTARRIARSGKGATKDLKTLIEPWIDRCRALRAQGFIEQAKAECLIARSFSPTDDEPALLLGDLHRLLGELDQAARLYQEVRERDRASVGALLGLGATRTLQGRYRDAISLLEQAEQIEPGNALLLNNLAAVHLQLAGRISAEGGDDSSISPHVARARSLFQAAASLEPRMAEPRAGLAEIYSFIGNRARALVEIERAVILDPSCVFRGRRGQALMENGRAQEASRLVEEVLLECPDELVALGTKAILLADRGCWTQARDTWGRMLEIVPGHPPALSNRADLEASGMLDRGDQDCTPL